MHITLWGLGDCHCNIRLMLHHCHITLWGLDDFWNLLYEADVTPQPHHPVEHKCVPLEPPA